MTTPAGNRRLIEDYLPVDWLSAEASGEPRTKGHISTLHLWRAQRPRVACRAAIYAALVDARESADERDAEEGFLKDLCRWGTPANIVQQARRKIGRDRAVVPRVLDCFAGGGTIPLEALRLGCDAYALDLNPVAFLILKATCEYPQRFGHALAAEERARALERELGVTTMDALIPPTGNADLATGKSYLYGIDRFRDAYTSRQRAVLLE